MDLEYHNALPSKEGCVILSLIQISTFQSDFVIDVFMLRDKIREQKGQGSLFSMFGDFKVVKILHGGDSDLKYLIADLGIVTVNVFDTARALSFIQRIPNLNTIKKQKQVQISKNVNYISLDKLTNLFVKVNLDKFF